MVRGIMRVNKTRIWADLGLPGGYPAVIQFLSMNYPQVIHFSGITYKNRYFSQSCPHKHQNFICGQRINSNNNI